uniref:Putative conserved plasma membrane protein n=1 Tax=Amblyomma triste TaxID=251400 RepID=A0A023G808_AMBTT
MLLLVMMVLALVLYIGPSLFRWVRRKTPIMIDPSIGCVALNVDPFLRDVGESDASLYRSYESSTDKRLLSFVGNGKIGFSVDDDNTLYVFNNRTLSLALPFHPGVEIIYPQASHQEGNVVHFVKGTVFRYQCFNKRRKTISVSHTYYAHRTIPSLLVQSVKIVNPLSDPITFGIEQKGSTTENLQAKPLGIKDRYGQENIIWHGKVSTGSAKDTVIAFALVTPKLPSTVTVEPKSSTVLRIQTLVDYSGPLKSKDYPSAVSQLQSFLKEEMQRVVSIESHILRNMHVDAWSQLWSTGFGISQSKAYGALNGDVINGTIYYILSHVRALASEWNTGPAEHRELQALLAYPEHCYGGHHTLQASTLWPDSTSLQSVTNAVNLWMLTLENQGCSKLIKTGAEGVLQAVVLSLGAFLFKDSHLELNIQPKDLHRELFFRRISYGNATHLNVSVVLGDDNKALLRVWLDRSDRDYYACDGGCLDPPVKLDFKAKQFPVKVTEPVTAVLYITSDLEHMKELSQTIHVKEVVEAPAHEHHVIALHRHGHQLGGLPALFWVSITFLIVVFHLFLAKLIYNEYCGSSQEKTRGRYVV